MGKLQPIPIFTGHVDEAGKLSLTEQQRCYRRAWLDTLKGQDVEVVIRKKRRQRSLQQSNYLHAVPFAILAEFFGEDIETTKLLVLGECFGWRDVQGGRIPVKPSTAALTVEETSHLIEWMPPWAMTNFRVRIPLPNEAEAA